MGEQTNTSIKKGKGDEERGEGGSRVGGDEAREGELCPATSIVKQQVSYREGESTMQANAFLQSAWGKWLVNQLNERGFMSRKGAKFSGAYITGGSP